MKWCCKSSGIELISQSTDSISLIRLPIKYPFTWTEGTGSSWQTPPAIPIPDANIRSNIVIFCASHNKYLSFYRPIISHRNMPCKYIFIHCMVWIKGIIKGSHLEKSNVPWSLEVKDIGVLWKHCVTL